MVIDEILDRKDGFGYNPEEFYNYVMEEESIDMLGNRNISRALDSGTNKDIQKALCDYIINNGYNPDICNYVNSVNWLEEE